MAEVDEILVRSLRQLGCELTEEITNIRQFDTDMLVDAVTSCLRVISPDFDRLPTRLSASMTVKYKQASTIADACKAVGYSGDLGYEAFLYGSENDMRKLLSFLLDRLPKEDLSSVSLSALPYGSILTRDIREGIEYTLQRPWLPPAFWRLRSPTSAAVTKAMSPFRSQHLSVPFQEREYSAPLFAAQCSSSVHLLLGSVLELNSFQLASSGRIFSTTESPETRKARLASRQALIDRLRRESAALQKRDKRPLGAKPVLPPRRSKKLDANEAYISPVPTATEVRVFEVAGGESSRVELSCLALSLQTKPTDHTISTEAKIGSLRVELNSTTEKVEALRDEVQNIASAVQNAETAIREGQEYLTEFERTLTTKQRISESLEGNKDQISPTALQDEIDRLKEVVEDLHQEWVEAREKLVERVSAVRQQAYSSNTVERLQEEIRECRKSVSTFHAELNERDDYVEVVRKEYNRLSADSTLPRAAYTKRILEILANIKKQRLDIDKIIKETRVVQKEINILSGRLDRAFVETDELMFGESGGGAVDKKGGDRQEFVKKAYKHVAAFHDICSQLVECVETTGQLQRESRDLEDEVDTEIKKDKATNVERIVADLDMVRRENAVLMEKQRGPN